MTDELSAPQLSSHHHKVDERYARRISMAIAAISVVLAITTFKKEALRDEGEDINRIATDNFAFYQTKSVRQSVAQLANQQLEAVLATTGSSLPPEQRAAVQHVMDENKEMIKRVDSDPQNGNG